eukprot:9139046-Pyramimonas_sp.AAC.1
MGGFVRQEGRPLSRASSGLAGLSQAEFGSSQGPLECVRLDGPGCGQEDSRAPASRGYAVDSWSSRVYPQISAGLA